MFSLYVHNHHIAPSRYGLAYARIYEVTRAKRFLSISKDIFDWVWSNGWDTDTCGGGVWFDNNYSGKETIENVQMIQLGLKLARLSRDTKYSDKAKQVLSWVLHVGIVNRTSFQVYDGINLNSCQVRVSHCSQH